MALSSPSFSPELFIPPSAPSLHCRHLPQRSFHLRSTQFHAQQQYSHKKRPRVPAIECSSSSAEVSQPFLHGSSVAAPIRELPLVEGNAEKMREWIETIRAMFCSMTLGEISISAYDTAWVALVPDLNGRGGPQFPNSVEWLKRNQLPDGSWGDKDLFLAYDRVCSTVACVVALKTWNTGEENIKRGLEFIHGNVAKIEAEVDDYMPIGFEIVFPAMLDDAKDLGLDLPYDAPMVIRIQQERERKLKKIPMELLHTYPTTLLCSLEGLHKIVDWNRLLKLQSKNGSFLFSPASTACALKYTGDPKCLEYLTMALEKFDDAVPNVYPVDLFERLWVVDRLERLGISRYFKREIKDCLDYVYRHWTERGIAWASESEVYDADDTAMGFRLLRLHGYDVSPDVFRGFKKDNQFFCFEGQTSEAVTGMYNLYRASQTMLPGETILEDIKHFTKTFLERKVAKNEVQDNWIIAKNLHGEVEYSLNYPWCASLPRIETRQYIDQYGSDDIWIGKSLYKMFFVNNEIFLDLAKADYNLCQTFHQKELAQLTRWYKECQFDQLGFARHKTIESFFSLAATLFEPEYGLGRLVWARCSVLATMIDDFFDIKGSIEELTAFLDAIKSWDPSLIKGFSQEGRILFMGLYNTMNAINQEAFVYQGRDIIFDLRRSWTRWITVILDEAKWTSSQYAPSFEEYFECAKVSIALEPIVHPTLFFLGERIPKDIIYSKEFFKMMDLVNIVGRLNNDIQGYKRETSQGKCSSVNIYLRENLGTTEEDAIKHFKLLIEQSTVLLVQEFLKSTCIPRPCRQLYFNTGRIMNFFYRRCDGFSSLTEMSQHVNSILCAAIP